MADFETKQLDTRNALKATLKQDGAVINLTGCNCSFSMSKNGKETINREINIIDPTNGVVLVTFSKEELQIAGSYKGEFIVTWSDGKAETIPNNDYLDILIRKNL